MDSKNSMLERVRLLYHHIFIDLMTLHPSISTELQRDLSRLLKAELSTGLSLYTILLPAGCKWLEKSLSAGRLESPAPLPFGVRGAGDCRPKLLFGLFSQIFEPDGTLRSPLEPSMVQSLRQVLLAMKKFDMECERKHTDETVRKFHEIEKSLPKPRDGTWNDNVPSWTHLTGHPIWGPAAEFNGQACLPDLTDPMLQLDDVFDWEGLRRFSARVLYGFGQFDPFSIRPKHGPGAVSDRFSGYVKYDHRLWSDRLEAVFPYDYHANGSLRVPSYVKYEEQPSQMHAVPKTQSGPRLIAAEPTAHQWIQQGIRRWLEDQCGCTSLSRCIDFRSQEKSREMALRASYDGLSATVDLSSASDRLSVRLVEFLLQSNPALLDALHASRTRALRSLNGELLLLKKFATQGSAVIFPLQSICYCILALWSVALARGLREYDDILPLFPLVRVFGDDIVIPTDAYPVLNRLFESVLLKVNEGKSHATGSFRESCGMDAFAGVDVTPAYLRRFYSNAPEDLSSVVEASNNFFKKGFWHTAAYLERTVPEAQRKLILIGTDLGSVCLYSFCGDSFDHLHSRWNKDLHRTEYRAISVDTKVDAIVGNGEGSLTQFFFEEPDPLLPYRSGQASTPRFRKKAKWVSTER